MRCFPFFFLLLKSFHPLFPPFSVYNLQNYSESWVYVHRSAKSANLGYGKCFTCCIFKDSLPPCLHSHYLFQRKKKISQKFWYQPFFHCPKQESIFKWVETKEGLHLLEKNRVLLVWGFSIPKDQGLYLCKG